MDYEAIIHAFIDDMVADKTTIMIKSLPNESENELTYVIMSTNDDIARLIGKKGIVASALREVVSIASKLEGKRIHLKFDSYEEKEEDKKDE